MRVMSIAGVVLLMIGFGMVGYYATPATIERVGEPQPEFRQYIYTLVETRFGRYWIPPNTIPIFLVDTHNVKSWCFINLASAVKENTNIIFRCPIRWWVSETTPIIEVYTLTRSLFNRLYEGTRILGVDFEAPEPETPPTYLYRKIHTISLDGLKYVGSENIVVALPNGEKYVQEIRNYILEMLVPRSEYIMLVSSHPSWLVSGQFRGGKIDEWYQITKVVRSTRRLYGTVYDNLTGEFLSGVVVSTGYSYAVTSHEGYYTVLLIEDVLTKVEFKKVNYSPLVEELRIRRDTQLDVRLGRGTRFVDGYKAIRYFWCYYDSNTDSLQVQAGSGGWLIVGYWSAGDIYLSIINAPVLAEEIGLKEHFIFECPVVFSPHPNYWPAGLLPQQHIAMWEREYADWEFVVFALDNEQYNEFMSGSIPLSRFDEYEQLYCINFYSLPRNQLPLQYSFVLRIDIPANKYILIAPLALVLRSMSGTRIMTSQYFENMATVWKSWHAVSKPVISITRPKPKPLQNSMRTLYTYMYDGSSYYENGEFSIEYSCFRKAYAILDIPYLVRLAESWGLSKDAEKRVDIELMWNISNVRSASRVNVDVYTVEENENKHLCSHQLDTPLSVSVPSDKCLLFVPADRIKPKYDYKVITDLCSVYPKMVSIRITTIEKYPKTVSIEYVNGNLWIKVPILVLPEQHASAFLLATKENTIDMSEKGKLALYVPLGVITPMFVYGADGFKTLYMVVSEDGMLATYEEGQNWNVMPNNIVVEEGEVSLKNPITVLLSAFEKPPEVLFAGILFVVLGNLMIIADVRRKHWEIYR